MTNCNFLNVTKVDSKIFKVLMDECLIAFDMYLSNSSTRLKLNFDERGSFIQKSNDNIKLTGKSKSL